MTADRPNAYVRAARVLDEYGKDVEGHVALIWRIEAAICEAVAAERAACAEVARNYPNDLKFVSNDTFDEVCRAAFSIAQAIEERGKGE